MINLKDKKPKVPRLRFRGFSDEWVDYDLGQLVSQMQSGLSRKLSNNDIGLPVIRSNNIKDQSIDISDISYWHIDDPQGAKTRNYYLEDGDLLVNFINSVSQIGKFAVYKNILKRPAIFTTNIMRLNFKDITTSKFVAYNFTKKYYVDFIQSITKPAVNQASFTTVDFKKYKVSLPRKKEQKKITGFLGVVDDKISALQNKKELLQRYKKGVMQKLFSQEIRFKNENGKDYSTWQEKRLDEVLAKNSTKNKGNRHLLVQSVSNTRGFVDQSDLFNDRVIASKDLSNYYVIEKGTFAYNPSRIDVGSLAYKLDNQTAVVSPLYISFQAKQKLLHDKFLLYWFERSDFIKQMNSSFEGSVRNTLSYDSLKRMQIKLPVAEEQEKIADFLTAIDDKINLTKKELEQAKTFKKALLQRMFV